MRATLPLPMAKFSASETTRHQTAEWLFRIGVFMCFVGHGAFGIITKEAWLPYFAMVGIGAQTAYILMPLIGVMDITLGIIGLVSPRRVILAYMVFWTTWTAALRPLTGESIWEFFERAGNYGVPLAFLIAVGVGVKRGWFSKLRTADLTRLYEPWTAVVLRVSTVMLLFGHGMLAITGANGNLANHLAAIGASPSLAPVLGGVEVGLALALVFQLTPSFLIGVALWKLSTEMLFAISGAPVWEVVERGGSYVAPLLLALLVSSSLSATHNTNRLTAAGEDK